MRAQKLAIPREGLLLPHLRVVSDRVRSRECYRTVFGADVVHERAPVMEFSNAVWRMDGTRNRSVGG
jgi:hypothetical protein